MGRRGIRRKQLLDDVKEKRAQIIRSLIMERRIHVMGRRGIRRKQLLDDIKEKRAQIIRSLMLE